MSRRWLSSLTHRVPRNETVSVPQGYRVTKEWVPTVGDIVPNFSCHSTCGDFSLFDYAEGYWTFLMNQPNAHGAVCTTEIVALASAKQEFAERGCRIVSVTQELVDEETRWIDEIDEHFHMKVWFPMIADPQFKISELFGMTHFRQNKQKAVRKTFLIDPTLRVRAIWEYPLVIGRSVTEMLRLIDAQLAHTRNRVVMPCDWFPGEPALAPHTLSSESVLEKYGNRVRHVAPGVRLVDID